MIQREKQFEEHIGALRIFYEEVSLIYAQDYQLHSDIHKHAIYISTYEQKGHVDPSFMDGKLALWVRKMKSQYRKYLNDQPTLSNNNSTPKILSPNRVAALESAGFKPGMFNQHREPVKKYRVSWEERYEELVTFKQLHGHCVVPKNYGSLGSWVRAQRHLMKKDALPEDKIDLLSELDFVWDVHQWQWNQTFHDLIEYKRTNGHTNVPMSQGSLGLWVSNQRAHYNNYRQKKPSHMTQSRAEQLRSIGFEFYSGKRLRSEADEKWYLRFIELKRYCDARGTCNVERSSNPALYNWCNQQKKEYRKKLQGKKSSFRKSREEALQSIGFLDGITMS